MGAALPVSVESASEQIDALAREYVECERLAADGHESAYLLDTQYEDCRTRLISLVWTSGPSQDEWRILRGTQYEARLKLVPSQTIDTAAISVFRYGMMKEVPPGTLQDVFRGSVSWRFTENAHEIISKLKMSKHLAELYRKCRPAVETPILEVRPIAP